MVDEELKQSAEEGMRKISDNIKMDAMIKKFALLSVVAIFGFLLGVAFMSLSESKNISISSECALRNTEQFYWIPSVITQKDINGNVVGIPVCVPMDKNTGQRVKFS